MTTIEPYTHECPHCTWVSWIYVPGGGKHGSDWGNMYLCRPDATNFKSGSVIIRFSDEPSDYWSCPVGASIKGALSLPDEPPNHHCAESCGDDPNKPAAESDCSMRRDGKCPEDTVEKKLREFTTNPCPQCALHYELGRKDERSATKGGKD